MQLFFVGGAPKSGTTWVQRSLDLHPEVVCSGEGHVHEFLIKPMYEMFGRYNTKLEEVARIVYEGKPYHSAVTREEAVPAIRKTVIDVLSRRAGPGTRALGDKTPAYVFTMRDLHLFFPEMLFISVARDPRDVAASRLNHAFRAHSPDSLATGSHLYREIVSASAQAWANAYERSRNFATAFPDRVLSVRYEDLLDDCSANLARMFDFLGVESSASQLATIMAQTDFEALSGRKPGIEDKSSFYRKGIKGDWPNVLDHEAMKTVLAACTEGMQAMGYIDAEGV